MTPQEAAQILLDREKASPGTFPEAAVARARGLAAGQVTVPEQTITPDGPGRTTIPEQTIQGSKPSLAGDLFGRYYPESKKAEQYGPLPPEAAANQPGRLEKGIGDAVGAAYAGADSFANSALLGVPRKLGLTGPETPEQEQFFRGHPTAGKVGEFAGAIAPGNPANLVGAGLFGKAAEATSALKRIAGAAANAGTSSALNAGARTAVEGGSADDVGRAATEAGLVGGLTGGALQGTLGEGARALRGGLRSAIPEIAQAESGGAKTSLLRGIVPGSEQKAIQNAAAGRGIAPVDYQADLLTGPLMQTGRQSMKDLNARIGTENAAFGATPSGNTPQSAGKLLDALTAEHAANVGANGEPLAGAGGKLSFLRDNIGSLADVELSPQGSATPTGAQRLSYRDAIQQGFDVAGAAKAQLEHPDSAPAYDVVVTPRKYNAGQALQTITNMDERLKAARNPQGPNIGISGKIDAAAHSLKGNYPGLAGLRAQQASVKGPLTDQLDMAGVADPSDKTFLGAEDKKRLFQSLRGYGDTGRIPAQDEALRAIAGNAGNARQLQLLQSLKALERLRAEQLPPASIRPSGQPGVSLTKRGIGLRADPLLELLMGTPVPLGRAAGEETGR